MRICSITDFGLNVIKRKNKNINNDIISFSKRQPSPIYLINNDGLYKRYEKIKDAAAALNTSPTSVIWSRDKKILLLNKYIVVNAQDIESTEEDGSCKVQEDKIVKLRQEYKGKKLIPIYAVNAKGEYKRYPHIKEAARDTQTEIAHLRNYINNGTIKDGILYVRAEDVETSDNSGNIIPDEIKLNKLYAQRHAAENKNYRAVYVINKAGKFKRCESIKEASREYDVSEYELKKCLEKVISSIGDLSFIYASEAEYKDSEGNRKLSKSVLRDLYRSAFGDIGR